MSTLGLSAACDTAVADADAMPADSDADHSVAGYIVATIVFPSASGDGRPAFAAVAGSKRNRDPTPTTSFDGNARQLRRAQRVCGSPFSTRVFNTTFVGYLPTSFMFPNRLIPFFCESVGDEYKGKYEVVWDDAISRPTCNQYGTTGWVRILQSTNPSYPCGYQVRAHLCANNPCQAKHDGSKYGEMQSNAPHMEPSIVPCRLPLHVTAYAPSSIADCTLAPPAVAEPALAEPEIVESAVGHHPAFAEPAVAEPEVAEPAVAESAAAWPAVAESAAVEPAVAETAVADPSDYCVRCGIRLRGFFDESGDETMADNYIHNASICSYIFRLS